MRPVNRTVFAPALAFFDNVPRVTYRTHGARRRVTGVSATQSRPLRRPIVRRATVIRTLASLDSVNRIEVPSRALKDLRLSETLLSAGNEPAATPTRSNTATASLSMDAAYTLRLSGLTVTAMALSSPVPSAQPSAPVSET